MDRRLNKRFRVEDNVIIALRNQVVKIGKVLDIGRGGLSFEHIYENLEQEISHEGTLLFVGGYSLPAIPCRVVYNVPAPLSDEYQAFIIQIETRRCGVQFTELTEELSLQLNSFIRGHTRKELV
jgi:hypothetical protein